MIEFWLTRKVPIQKYLMKKTILFHCKADWRSALTVQTVTTMGLENAIILKADLLPGARLVFMKDE